MNEAQTAALMLEGQTALQRGDWDAARRAFETLQQTNPTPEVLEGVADAAWWQDDAEAMFAARERAYQLYREAGDNLGAARTALWLGNDYIDFRGEMAISSGWRQLCRGLLDELPTSAEHGWFAAIEGDIALMLEDDTDAARRWAQEAIAIGRRLGDPDIECYARTVEGVALVTEGEVAEGMRRLDASAAAATAGELKEQFSVNLILCHLIYACERSHDYTRAAQWCQRAREYADRMGFAFAQGTCRVHYAGVLLWRGKWQEAEQELEDAGRYLMRSRPPYEVEARVRLGELRRRQGRPQEAGDLFRDVDWHPLATLGLAQLALEEGKLQDAEEFVQRVLRNVPAKSISQRTSALDLLARIQSAQGQPAAAQEAYQQLVVISKTVATEALLAATACLSGVLAAAVGDHEAARRCFEDAAAQFERSGAPYEAARARLDLAQALSSLGRTDRARQVAGAALEAFRALGASSEAARAERVVADLDGAGATDGAAVLTARQLEVLRLIAQGLSDREIAAALVMSEHTVHRHVANILQRLSLPSRAAAVGHASRIGLL